MKKNTLIAPALAVLLAGFLPTAGLGETSFEGVDKTVVEKFADQAGRPASAPLINTDQGDVLLFVFLAAGAVGGFVGGYAFRGLFPPGKDRESRGTLRA